MEFKGNHGKGHLCAHRGGFGNDSWSLCGENQAEPRGLLDGLRAIPEPSKARGETPAQQQNQPDTLNILFTFV